MSGFILISILHALICKCVKPILLFGKSDIRLSPLYLCCTGGCWASRWEWGSWTQRGQGELIQHCFLVKMLHVFLCTSSVIQTKLCAGRSWSCRFVRARGPLGSCWGKWKQGSKGGKRLHWVHGEHRQAL